MFELKTSSYLSIALLRIPQHHHGSSPRAAAEVFCTHPPLPCLRQVPVSRERNTSTEMGICVTASHSTTGDISSTPCHKEDAVALHASYMMVRRKLWVRTNLFHLRLWVRSAVPSLGVLQVCCLPFLDAVPEQLCMLPPPKEVASNKVQLLQDWGFPAWGWRW